MSALTAPNPAPDVAVDFEESKGLESIIARTGGSVIVPFSRSGNGPEYPQTYAPLIDIHSVSNAVLSDNDLRSVHSVAAHIAHSQEISEEQVLAMIEMRFAVSDVKEIHHSQLQDVMEFLIDLRLDGVRSRR